MRGRDDDDRVIGVEENTGAVGDLSADRRIAARKNPEFHKTVARFFVQRLWREVDVGEDEQQFAPVPLQVIGMTAAKFFQRVMSRSSSSVFWITTRLAGPPPSF